MRWYSNLVLDYPRRHNITDLDLIVDGIFHVCWIIKLRSDNPGFRTRHQDGTFQTLERRIGSTSEKIIERFYLSPETDNRYQEAKNYSKKKDDAA